MASAESIINVSVNVVISVIDETCYMFADLSIEDLEGVTDQLLARSRGYV